MTRLAGSIAAAAFATVALASPRYALLHSYKLGGEGGWDYLTVDSASHRLFISRGTHMTVMNTDNGQIIGDIPDTPGVHGAAIATRDGYGFTSNGRDNTVSVFDLRTLKTLRKIKVGDRPDAIIFEPRSNRVFTYNAGSSDTTAIDAHSLEVVGTVALGGKPETPVYDDQGNIYVNIEDKSQILEYNASTLKVSRTISLSPGEEPSGLAIDKRHGYLFPTCSNNQMPIVSINQWKVVARPVIGNGPDAAGFDPRFGMAFSPNGQDGTITVIQEHPDGTFTVEGTVPTAKSARTMALDEKTHRIYLASAQVETTPDASATPGQRSRRRMVPGSFTILVVGPQ